MSDKDWGLACKHCSFVFPEDISVGVARAHFETEHDTDRVEMDLVLLCNRCHKPMTLFATVGVEDHFQCTPCKRGRIFRRAS